MSNLFLMMGIPGSGKSTFLKKINSPNSIIVSRDEIRFSLIVPDGDYFSREKDVCEILWNKINDASTKYENIYVDQTSLTKKSRKYLLDNINIENFDTINLIWIKTDLNTCLERNRKRSGLAFVPEKNIRKMYSQMVIPSYSEGFDIIYYYDDKTQQLSVMRR